MRTRTTIAAIAVSAALLSPFIVSAQSVAQLQAQIAAVIAQIHQVQAQVGGSSTASSPATPAASAPQTASAGSCPQFTRVLSLGSTGSDVTGLQTFLAENPIIYPEGTVTGYFGALTQAAVQRWQSAYDVVTSGTPATTGYGIIGPRTAQAMEASCAGGYQLSTSNSMCPVSPTPTIPCTTSAWTPVRGADGCTAAWQCAWSTSTTTTTTTTTVTSSSTAPATGVSPTGVSTSGSACPTYTLPLCSQGSTIWLGMSDGCNLGYTCVAP